MGARGSPSPPGRGLLGRWPWLPTAVVGLLAVTALGGPVFLHPTRAALGSAWSEGPGHLWGLWCTTLGLWDHGPFLRVADIAWPDGFTGHLMDPVNLLVFGPFYALGGGGPRGAALGWNALHVAVPIAGAAGCWSLGRRLAGDHPAAPWAIALLAAVVCMSPYMLEFPFIGRTEFLPAMLVPGHVALLHRWMRAPVGPGRPGTPEPPPPWPVGLAAGLTLGGVALGGWYLAAFVACLDVPLGLWLACGRPWREALGRLALVVAVAAACVTPDAIALLGHPPAGSAGFFPAWPTPPRQRPTTSVACGSRWRAWSGCPTSRRLARGWIPLPTWGSERSPSRWWARSIGRAGRGPGFSSPSGCSGSRPGPTSRWMPRLGGEHPPPRSLRRCP